MLLIAALGRTFFLGSDIGVWVARPNQSLLAVQGVAPTTTSIPLLTDETGPGPIPDVAITVEHCSKDQPGHVPFIHDTGSMCPDRLEEGINLAVAQKTLAFLRQTEYRVTLIEEFDRRLKDPALGETPDYCSRAFLLILRDACQIGPDYPLATGCKVAHAETEQRGGRG